MVIIYLAKGETVTVSKGVKAGATTMPGALGNESREPALVCFDNDNQPVAAFRMSEVAGYVVNPDGEPS